MKSYLVLLAAVLFAFSTSAQEAADSTQAKADSVKYWEKGGLTTLTFNQVSLSNWAAGGENAITTTAFMNLFANYKKEDLTWDNSLDLGYGITKQGDAPFIKNDDRIEANSKFGKYFTRKLYYSALVNFRTQFAPGFSTPAQTERISDFMSPGYLNLLIGLDYKPSKKFTALFAPLSGKVTFVTDQVLADQGAFGVEAAVLDALGNVVTPGKNVRGEFGGYFKLAFNYDVFKNINFSTKLDLFSNYLVKPQNIDVNWETLLTMKVNKFFSANFGTLLIYDDDIKIGIDSNSDGVIDYKAPRTQFKQLFGFGFSYKF